MSSQLSTRGFWIAAAERALKTGAQVMAAAIIVDGVVDVLALDWVHTLSITIGAMLLSVLTSLGGLAVSGTGPSIAGAERLPGAPERVTKRELEERLRRVESELRQAQEVNNALRGDQ